MSNKKKNMVKDEQQRDAIVQLPPWVESLLKEVYRQKGFAFYYRSRAIALNVAVYDVLSHDAMEIRYRDSILKQCARKCAFLDDVFDMKNKIEVDELRDTLEGDVKIVAGSIDEHVIINEFKRRLGLPVL